MQRPNFIFRIPLRIVTRAGHVDLLLGLVTSVQASATLSMLNPHKSIFNLAHSGLIDLLGLSLLVLQHLVGICLFRDFILLRTVKFFQLRHTAVQLVLFDEGVHSLRRLLFVLLWRLHLCQLANCKFNLVVAFHLP